MLQQTWCRTKEVYKRKNIIFCFSAYKLKCLQAEKHNFLFLWLQTRRLFGGASFHRPAEDEFSKYLGFLKISKYFVGSFYVVLCYTSVSCKYQSFTHGAVQNILPEFLCCYTDCSLVVFTLFYGKLSNCVFNNEWVLPERQFWLTSV